MIDKKQILKELDQEFEKLKKELGFNATLEELDSVFGIKDSILSNGFVGEDLSRQISSKISEAYYNWSSYLNSLILPNPSFMPSQTESKLFSTKEDKELLWELINGAMKFVSKNSLDILKKDPVLQKEMIDGSLEYWKNKFHPKTVQVMQKIHDSWSN